MQEKVVDRLVEVLEGEKAVHAVWLEGSWAENKRDDMSDVDIWIDVEDGYEQQIYKLVEKTFQEFGELDTNFDMLMGHPEIDHRIYHIKGTNEHHIYEVCVQTHSRDIVLTKGINELHVFFDKDNTIRWKDYDETATRKELEPRAIYLREFFRQGVPIIKKQVKRGKYIDAFGYYVRWCLQPVVELARIKYVPAKSDYWIKDIEQDLPQELVDRLKPLFEVSSLEDIEQNLDRAVAIAKDL